MIYSLNAENKIEDIHYLVNLAGTNYDTNTPYTSTEPFFYLVSFTDDSGTGTYGTYDLSDNTVTLLKSDGTSHSTIMQIDSSPPMAERVISLPLD